MKWTRKRIVEIGNWGKGEMENGKEKSERA
jgi:hypothetical protein